MRTTIAIDDELLDELMKIEPNVTRSEAMRRAVEDYVRRKRLDQFMQLAGSRLIDLDWKQAEKLEVRKIRKHGAKR